MTVYELIQELANFRGDAPVFVEIRNTNTKFEVDSVDFEFRCGHIVNGELLNRVKITIDG